MFLKIPFTIRPLFWLVSAFIGWMSSMTLIGTLLWMGAILVSLLLHELGHALTARAFGQKCRIELAGFGGFTYREGRRLKLWQEFFVVLNGPLVGLLLYFGLSFWAPHLPLAEYPVAARLLSILLFINLFWTLINLLPILPLDGGHLLSILLESLFGFRGVKIALYLGVSIAALCALLAFLFQAFLLGALFVILLFEGVRSLRLHHLLKAEDRNASYQEKLQAAQRLLKEGRRTEAASEFEQLRQEVKEGILYTVATEELACLYTAQNRPRDAYGLLHSLGKNLSQERIPLLHLLAFIQGDYKAVVACGETAYQLAPTYETALRNAMAHSMLENVDPAVGWLNCAIREGLPAPRAAMENAKFDPIRKTTGFQKIILQ